MEKLKQPGRIWCKCIRDDVTWLQAQGDEMLKFMSQLQQDQEAWLNVISGDVWRGLFTDEHLNQKIKKINCALQCVWAASNQVWA